MCIWVSVQKLASGRFNSSINFNATEWPWPIKMPLQDHLLVKRPPGWVGNVKGGGGGGGGGNSERQLCNWLTLEGLQVQIARPLCCKLQTFVSPQVECFFQTLSLLHIWVQFSACPLSENQFLLLSSALFLQLCEQTRARGLHCPSPDPSKTTNGSYQLTPPCHPGGRGWKTGQAAPAWMCFWVCLPIVATLFTLKAWAIYESPGRMRAQDRRVGRIEGRELLLLNLCF